MTKPGVSYSEIRDQLRTCDLLLFRGSDFVSNTISMVEKYENNCGDFTHTGMCIRAESFYYPDNSTKPSWLCDGKIYILESTISGYKYITDGVPDVEGKNTLCVQLRDFDAVVPCYDKSQDTRMAWCQLLDECRPSGIDSASKELQTSYDKYRGLMYDASLVDLSAAAMPIMRPLRDNSIYSTVRDWFCSLWFGTDRSDSTDNADELPHDNVVSNWQFCSELVSNMYIDLGIFPKDVLPENVLPTDFLQSDTQSNPNQNVTNDKDKQVPLVFKPCVRFHS